MNRLDDKIALITGGARGNGAATAELFIAAGAKVIISDVLDEVGEATAANLGDACTYIHHDVTSADDWEKVVNATTAQHDRIDVLVNNAGIFRQGGVVDCSLDDWQSIIAINQTGVFLGMQAVAPTMKTHDAGSIINISSIAGMKSAAMAFAYSASKWAVRGMTKSAAVEFGPGGIRVNSVHPGVIDTDMMAQLGPEIIENLGPRIPLGRVGTADEVGQVVLFLASDDSSYCTGQEFVMDGGLTS